METSMGFKQRIMVGLLTAGVVILIGIPTPAQAATQFPIRTMASPRCLDADVATIGSNGTQVQLWDCTANATSQKWSYHKIADGHYLIINARSGRCLDADVATIGSNGTKVQLWTCTEAANSFGYATNQVWYRYLANGQNYWVNVDPRGNRRCLDADKGTIGSNGTKVQLWDCTAAAPGQDWHCASWCEDSRLSEPRGTVPSDEKE
jgi:hypothetical protein